MAAEAAPILDASLDDDSRRGHCACELEFSGGAKGGAKGTRTPALTTQNAVLAAVSFRLDPTCSRSVPAISLSALDGVKSALV
jgi:hypothetical protein